MLEELSIKLGQENIKLNKLLTEILQSHKEGYSSLDTPILEKIKNTLKGDR